jgi:hypothetical protein
LKNFLISALIDLILIFISYLLFKALISGSTRHRIYEKFFSSFAKFIILIFILSAGITGITSFILYKLNLIAYVNIIAPALVSLLVGFLMSTLPSKGVGDEKDNT